jgi:hypothetical protein
LCTPQEHGANPKTENRERKTPERMAKTKEVKDVMKKARTTSVPGALRAFSDHARLAVRSSLLIS